MTVFAVTMSVPPISSEVGSKNMAPVAKAHSSKLPMLDLGRFFAAAAVAMFHSSFTVYHFDGRQAFGFALRGGHAGVEYFFVLSGFIIHYAHRSDISVPHRFGRFFRKRAVRILPLLWIVLSTILIMKLALPQQATLPMPSAIGIVADFMLLPHQGPLLLGVAWTLQRELVFYLLFSISILNRSIGFTVLATWQLGIIISNLFNLTTGPWVSAIFNINNIGFGVGFLLSFTVDQVRLRHPRLLAWMGLLGFFALMAAEWYIGGPPLADFRALGDKLSPVLYTIAAGACVLGVVQLDLQRHRTKLAVPQSEMGQSTKKICKIFADLASSSYALYLTHGIVGSILIRAFQKLPMSAEVKVIALTIGSIIFALLAHNFIERPLISFINRKIERKRPHESASPLQLK